MNKVFEDFVAGMIKKYCNDKHLSIKTQENIFQLKPDIVGYKDFKASKDSIPHFIADTKWKILDLQEKNCGISQGDMYQMFAYLAKYKCTKGFLIYPQIEEIENQSLKKVKDFTFKSKIVIETSKDTKSTQTSYATVTLEVLFFPLKLKDS